MKLILFILLQIVAPVTWTATEKGDSVILSAHVEQGFHMSIFSVGGVDVEDENEYTEYSVTLAKAEASIRFNACDDQMCTAPELYTWVSEGSKVQEGSVLQDKSLWVIFLFGLLAGLLAIFTPCVWPIIPMTVSFFLKRTENGIGSAILYGVSIIVIYVGLGLLVSIYFGASALNALSTNAIMNIVFFAILVLFALSFFGLFELRLPSSWSTATD